MDVREKLLWLIAKAKYICANDYSDHTEAEYIADTLLDSDVIVQEWVSIEDGLPEDDRDVLAYSSIGEESRIYPACYSNGVWFDCVFNAPATDTTTHWMKMPQPPKGE